MAQSALFFQLINGITKHELSCSSYQLMREQNMARRCQFETLVLSRFFFLRERERKKDDVDCERLKIRGSKELVHTYMLLVLIFIANGRTPPRRWVTHIVSMSEET